MWPSASAAARISALSRAASRVVFVTQATFLDMQLAFLGYRVATVCCQLIPMGRLGPIGIERCPFHD